MFQDKFVFSQLVSFLDRNHFNYLVRKFDGDKYVKHFICWNQLLSLMFGQLSNRESLRDFIVALEAHQGKTYHLGLGKHVTRSNLAKANTNRDYRIFEAFAYYVVGQAQTRRKTNIFNLRGKAKSINLKLMKNKFFSMHRVLAGVLVLQAIFLLSLFLYALFAYCPVMQSEQMYQPDNIKLLNAKVELLQKHESWTIEILGIAFVLTTILFGLIQWFLSQKSEILINNQLTGAKEKIYEELTQKWNMDKNAFKKSIDMKAVELSLMADYPIYIISDERGEKSNSTKLYNMLVEFHFEKIDRITYKEAEKIGDFCEKSVVAFCDPDTKNKDKRGKEKALVEKLLAKNSHLGVFGFAIWYDASFNEMFNDKGCISFAQFPSQVYTNLMSLLHYKRYLNSII